MGPTHVVRAGDELRITTYRYLTPATLYLFDCGGDVGLGVYEDGRPVYIGNVALDGRGDLAAVLFADWRAQGDTTPVVMSDAREISGAAA